MDVGGRRFQRAFAGCRHAGRPKRAIDLPTGKPRRGSSTAGNILHPVDQPGRESNGLGLMTQFQGRPFLIRQIRSGALTAVALTILLAAPSFAQDAGVSGIPPGPGNINGLNNSGRDPSGIGNAAKMPPLPAQVARPVTPPTVAPYPSTLPPRVVAPRYPRYKSARERRKAEEAQVRENNRLLNRGVTSICRGC